jgi:hypothetical protein
VILARVRCRRSNQPNCWHWSSFWRDFLSLEVFCVCGTTLETHLPIAEQRTQVRIDYADSLPFRYCCYLVGVKLSMAV